MREGELAFRFGEYTSRVLLRAELQPLDPGSARAGASAGAGAAPGGLLPVFDAHTWRLFGDRLLGCSEGHRSAGRRGADRRGGGRRGEGRAAVRPVVLPPGERSKSWRTARRVLEEAARRSLGRDGRIVGVGGGVVGDLAAFCASVYMRGCALTLVPTTLLAMVDACLGGKTGVDLRGAKNAAGTFYPAEQIHIVPSVLASLPEREYRCGLAEAVKTALLGDGELLALLEQRLPRLLAGREAGLLAEVVVSCLRIKGRVVEEDFREAGAREALNLGHTFAHALESVGGLRRWSHGEAVAWGLKMAMRLGRRLGVTPAEHARRVEALLAACGFDLQPRGLSPRALLRAMAADKKRRGGRLRFVLQSGVGRTAAQAVEEGLVLEVLAAAGGGSAAGAG